MAEPQDATKDFNALELSVQAHGEGITSLGSKVTALENKLNTPELLAKTLEDASKDSKKLDTLFSKLFCDLLKKDENVKICISEHMNEIDRAFWKRFRGRAGFAAWSIFLVVVSVIGTAWAVHHFGK